MSEELQSVSTEQQVSSDAPAEQTLDDVFKSFTPESEPVQQSQYVQPQAQPKQEIHIPDPAMDLEGFKRYEATRQADSQVLRNAYQTLDSKLRNIEATEAKRREEADIAKAVSFLKQKAPEVDDDMLEIYLGHKARKEPKLLQIWQGRDKNPKAWDAALKAIGNEVQGKFAVKTDPQLTENVRAMKTSQQNMATANKEPSIDEKLGKLSGAAFDHAMSRIRNGQDPGL